MFVRYVSGCYLSSFFLVLFAAVWAFEGAIVLVLSMHAAAGGPGGNAKMSKPCTGRAFLSVQHLYFSVSARPAVV